MGPANDDVPPPTDHVLRPHHVDLLTILVYTFKEPDCKNIPAAFLLHLYRTLLGEISEVSRPRSHQDLMQTICSGPNADSDKAKRVISAITTTQSDLTGADQFTSFFGNLPSLFVEKAEDEAPVLMRRSIFGYFCRRCFVSFIKLSFSGVIKLQKDYQAWCFGNTSAGCESVFKDEPHISDLLIFKTQADKKSWAKPDPYEDWEKAQSTGDENMATESLRRFFEQHFHESHDSGIRQHALLNLVRMHYLRNEIPAARKVLFLETTCLPEKPWPYANILLHFQFLMEAIAVCRTSGDKTALQHCMSMLHRLPPTDSERKPTLNELQPDLHPLEVLFDVKKLLDPRNNQPLSAAFVKIIQANGLYDHWLETQNAPLLNEDQCAHHAVQSVVWDAMGCSKLARIEESIVMAFTQRGSEDHNRITVLLNSAYQKARQGAYSVALAMLLEPHVWCGLSLNDYTAWAQEIWHILSMRATRRGQARLFREFLLPRRPPGDYNPRLYVLDVVSASPNKIRDPLYDVIQMRHRDQATSCIEQLLKALWHSEFLTRYGDYRTSVILLADVSMEFNMPKRSRRILEELMPQIISGDDLEQRAFACLTLARSIIASGGSTATTLKEALSYLTIAEGDYNTLGINASLLHVQYLTSVIYHNLGMTQERDAAAMRHLGTLELQSKQSAVVVEEDIKQVLEVVDAVGACLAARV